MDDMYLPTIADEDDFKSFQSIMHHELEPPTYADWLDRHAKRVAYHGETHTIIEVQVKPDDFERYLRAGSHGADMNNLLAFAEIVGKRRKK